ncbi:cytochrome bd-I ubiquinol oxidase subunit 2 apoprotein [Desulfuromonas soudanensis]|uniref:Cytochrome bd-I ubiquinol oxidase subunit 2 apoprotein n=1 Tax=Desulfuromonas soudanensis TaxID=1603606 RepID=A0A0M4D6X4_9BACT|nr:cytochrome d ubiquinol oxidase subunit II [Desulfuromonas soudanensis]ALC15130.1 cytochrome bd-I ubiquinol oxidase subunit 2 apoprotein [Desulfuromonas soudanensis]
MFGKLDLSTLQQLWWIITSVVGSLFVMLTFVQGGQTLVLTLGGDPEEKNLIVNSLGRKWELTFTTLVLFGGALYAAFPLFYASSFGGAYWVWISILLTFVIQAVSYEFRRKPNNFLGERTYEIFLLINGTVGILLIGAAVGTFFTGSNFVLNDYNLVRWTHPLRGLEAAFSLFNLSFGLFLVFLARTLGALYLANNLGHETLVARLKKSSFSNFLAALPFLLYVLIRLLTMDGFAFNPGTGAVTLEAHKYLNNLLQMPLVLVLLLAGLLLVVAGVALNRFTPSVRGIWPAGLGTVLTCLAIFSLAGFNNTPFYPSRADLASSLTIYNASSSHYTLTMMSYVALAVPLVLAYVSWVWKQMDGSKLTVEEVTADKKSY